MRRFLQVALLLSLAAGLPLSACAPAMDSSCDGGACADGGAADLMTSSCRPETAAAYKAVMSQLQVPTTMMPCSIDIDGDGRPDNALALVAGVLKGLFDLQGSVDGLVQSGELLELFTVHGASLTAENCASLTVAKGVKPAQPPVFDGSGMFMVSPDTPPLVIPATIAGGQLKTPTPEVQTTATLVQLQLALSAGFGVELPLPLYGVHVSGKVAAGGLISGQIHGVVKSDDVQNQIVPAVAKTMTAFINANPNSPNSATLIKVFETAAKCKAMPALCCATSPKTCQITPDEVRQNALISTVLHPDVQMWQGTTWMPNPHGTMPDSMSIGLCFNAVGASF